MGFISLFYTISHHRTFLSMLLQNNRKINSLLVSFFFPLKIEIICFLEGTLRREHLETQYPSIEKQTSEHFELVIQAIMS